MLNAWRRPLTREGGALVDSEHDRDLGEVTRAGDSDALSRSVVAFDPGTELRGLGTAFPESLGYFRGEGCRNATGESFLKARYEFRRGRSPKDRYVRDAAESEAVDGEVAVGAEDEGLKRRVGAECGSLAVELSRGEEWLLLLFSLWFALRALR